MVPCPDFASHPISDSWWGLDNFLQKLFNFVGFVYNVLTCFKFSTSVRIVSFPLYDFAIFAISFFFLPISKIALKESVNEKFARFEGPRQFCLVKELTLYFIMTIYVYINMMNIMNMLCIQGFFVDRGFVDTFLVFWKCNHIPI